MARIAGIDLPSRKRLEIGLTYIFGIGLAVSREILKKTQIDPGKKIDQLTDEDVSKLRTIIESDYKVEGSLRADVNQNIRRLLEIKSYRGLRHRRGLPGHGQRTKTNARTRKGPRRKIGAKKR